ncbi:hypothetical protein [Hirschia maritima]|uniref:hypothetical protein n=1 Tax=Hirschia maritima TaxID=1121961 RepID=UPI00037B4ADD|nr:hypothetical protein [Hirschia maritima]
MKILYGLATVFIIVGASISSALAENNNDGVVKDWTKTKCMNFRSNKEIAAAEADIERDFVEKKYDKVLQSIEELMSLKLGCKQRYELADRGYRASIALSDFSQAIRFMPVMRKQIASKGGDVQFFDQLVSWVEANRIARDSSASVDDRNAYAVRDLTLQYLLSDFRKKRKFANWIPTSNCDVVLSVTKFGRVEDVQVECDIDEVELSLEKHVPKILFAPKIKNGEPVRQEKFNFKVQID